jgi:hypothetical protein
VMKKREKRMVCVLERRATDAPQHHPGGGRGPIGRTAVVRSKRYPIWAPAFAGVDSYFARVASPEMGWTDAGAVAPDATTIRPTFGATVAPGIAICVP